MSPASLEENFGREAGDIDRKFDHISTALLDLIDTGRIDRDAFKAGEETLADIIAGMSKRVDVAKTGINPAVAEEYALFDRVLSNILRRGRTLDDASDDALETPVTPNEIDRMQQEALGAYILQREWLQVLVELHTAVCAINELIGRETPGCGPAR